MDQLWAPWRLAYIARGAPEKGGDECFICSGLAEADDRKNLIVQRTRLGAVLLNKFPYNNGHLLVAPRAHKATLQELTPDELLDSMEAVRLCVRALGELMSPDGYNVGYTDGWYGYSYNP